MHVAEYELNLAPMSCIDERKVIKQFDIKPEQLKDKIARVTGSVPHASSDDDFVWGQVERRAIALRWSAVVSYEPVFKT